MPYNFETKKKKIPKELDRRYKITDLDKENVRFL